MEERGSPARHGTGSPGLVWFGGQRVDKVWQRTDVVQLRAGFSQAWKGFFPCTDVSVNDFVVDIMTSQNPILDCARALGE